MHTTGIIFASVDTDHDNIESWNRWYDLEHLPPNIALPGITTGRRYVATPDLHAARLPERPLRGFADGQGVNVTIYTCCTDPADVIAEMTTYRDRLEAEGRMVGAGRRVVRAGDAMRLRAAVADPVLRAAPDEVAHLGHTAIRVVLWRPAADGDDAAAGADADAIARSVAEAAVAVDGVHGVLCLEAVFQAGLRADIAYLEGDPIAVTHAARAAAPYPAGVDVVLDAAFRVVVPFDYGFAEAIRASDLPASID